MMAWLKANAPVITLACGGLGAAFFLATSLGSMKAQVAANAELMKASQDANAKLLDSSLRQSQEAIAKLLDSSMRQSQDANAKLLESSMRQSQEANVKLLESSLEANAKLLDASIAQLGDKTRLIAENEALKTHREYAVRGDLMKVIEQVHIHVL